MSRVNVIIPTYQGRQHLPECLTTLEAQDIPEPFDVVLVDNASTDGSVDYVRTHHPRVQVVETGNNLGFAGACNAGIRATDGEYIVLLNNDTRLPTDWLRQLITAADTAAPDVFAIGSLLLLYHYPDRINSAGGRFSPMGGGFDHHLGEPIDSTPLPNDSYSSAIAPGAAVLYRRDIYQRLGGLDDRFFMYFEDVELCYRAWRAGYRCVMAPNAKVYHKHGATAGPRDSPIKVYWGQRNRIRMIARNMGMLWFAKSFAVLVAYSAFSFLNFLRDGRREVAEHLLKAVVAGCREAPVLRRTFARERQAAVRTDREIADMDLFATVPDVWAEGKRIRALRASGVLV